MIKKPLIFLINLYQSTISPDHSWLFKNSFPYGYCRHYPSCSEYAKQSINRFGAAKGLYLAVLRVFRCNPWTKPSFDPVLNSKF